MTQEQMGSEFGLSDILETVRRYKKIILIMPVICGLVAYVAVTFFMRPTWEASVLLQVGQIEQPGSEAKSVEPISTVIARMSQPSFAAEVLKRANLPSSEVGALSGILSASLKAQKVKDAELIEVRLRGYSKEMAQSLLLYSVDYIRDLHQKMMEPQVNRLQLQLQAADDDYQSVKAEVEYLKKQLQGNRDWNSYNATLSATVLQAKNGELRDLAQKKLMLTERLNPAMTFTTKIIGDVTASEGPVSPRKPLILGLAAMIGLLAGLFFAFVHAAVGRK
jgi:uncharacterized protein involved in exopolysaccharide biosynthesis